MAEHAARSAIKSGVALTAGKAAELEILTKVPFKSNVCPDTVTVEFAFISTVDPFTVDICRAEIVVFCLLSILMSFSADKEKLPFKLMVTSLDKDIFKEPSFVVY